MQREEAIQIINETQTDYKGEQHVLRGLQILAKYNDNLQLAFEHDQIWAENFDTSIKKMTKEDIIELAVYGWFESFNSWSHH